MYFAPQNLKPGCGPGSAKIMPAIRIFCFEGHSASRCSITSKTFFHKLPSRGLLQAFWGGQSWADTALIHQVVGRVYSVMRLAMADHRLARQIPQRRCNIFLYYCVVIMITDT